MNDVLRILAAWALLHESADDAWKAAVARGERRLAGQLGEGPDDGPDAFADALAALVAGEKERLKAALTASTEGGSTAGADHAELTTALRDLRFELAELRGRLESLQASVDALHEQQRP